MSLDEMYELAIKAGCSCKWGIYSFTEAELKKFVQFLIAAEREACAKVAESLWQQFQDTKNAHERNSLEPFMPGRFGFDQLTIQQSRHIAAAIRARSEK